MKIIKHVSRYMQANCYLVDYDGNGIIIDPCVNANIVLKNYEGNIKGIFLTHVHFDHFEEIKSYLKNDIKIYMHKLGFDKLFDPMKNCSIYANNQISINLPKDQIIFVQDGLNIEISKNFNVKVIATPGHTDCGVCYTVNDHMFTGDTLFKNTVGRTDLYSSNTAKMYDSLSKLNHIKSNYFILPGHGEQTTLDDEKSNNIYFRRGLK